jgi:hypothetical protein
MPKLRFRKPKEPATDEGDLEEPYTDLDSSVSSTATNMSSDTETPALDTVLYNPPTADQQAQTAAAEDERDAHATRRAIFTPDPVRDHEWDENLQRPAPASQHMQPLSTNMASEILNMMPTPDINKKGYTSDRGTHFRKIRDNRARREELELFFLRNQGHQTCTRPHFEETQRKPKAALNTIQPMQATLAPVQEEPSYANVKEASLKKSKYASAHKQKYTAASGKQENKNRSRGKNAYHSDESSHHGGYHSRDSSAYDLSDCKRALPGGQPSNKDSSSHARKSAVYKRVKAPRFSSSDSSDSSESGKGHRGGDNKRDRKSLTSSPIRRALGKPDEWGDPSRGHRSNKNYFKTPPIKQFSGTGTEDPK